MKLLTLSLFCSSNHNSSVGQADGLCFGGWGSNSWCCNSSIRERVSTFYDSRYFVYCKVTSFSSSYFFLFSPLFTFVLVAFFFSLELWIVVEIFATALWKKKRLKKNIYLYINILAPCNLKLVLWSSCGMSFDFSENFIILGLSLELIYPEF